MAPEQDDLVGRLRARLADEPSVREVSMFGGRAFMVDDRMAVSAQRNGDLLVRVAEQRGLELVEQQSGTTIAQMGAGRSMGPSWLSVEAGAIGDEDGLAFWLDEALRHNRHLA